MSAPSEDLAVGLARIEGKLDAYASRTSALEERVADLDVRLRETVAASDLRAVDERVRVLETKPTVSPAGLTAALVATVTTLGGFLAILERLTS